MSSNLSPYFTMVRLRLKCVPSTYLVNCRAMHHSDLQTENRREIGRRMSHGFLRPALHDTFSVSLIKYLDWQLGQRLHSESITSLGLYQWVIHLGHVTEHDVHDLAFRIVSGNVTPDGKEHTHHSTVVQNKVIVQYRRP